VIPLGYVVLGLLGLFAVGSAASSAGPSMSWTPATMTRAIPVRGARLTSPFGNRQHPILKTVKHHDGIDLAAPIGAPIYAVEPGHVVRVDVDGEGKGATNGNAVLVQSPSGLWAYLHMHTRPMVRVGQVIQTGQQLGLVGSSGRSTGPHLHLSLRRGGVYVDPWPAVGPLYGSSAVLGDDDDCAGCMCAGEEDP
jgi:murein DD-endopeptidase MepM/ murein hydrolase activator NlpD